jgi:two-component system sensor histidine kinase KdpD
VAAVLALLPFRAHINSTTVGLTLLLVVLFTAVGYGSRPALVASILAVLLFNFFFLPPYHTFTIADPQNWIALFAFLLTAVIVGSLSAREKRRAEEAERLYKELQGAFEKASQAEAFKQSEKLKSALLDAVTHDLRTPLTSMKAAVTTLLSGDKDTKTSLQIDEEGRRELLEVIDAEIDRLNRLVEGLIKMAKIEAGAMQPHRSWSSIDEIISIAMVRASAITQHHSVQMELQKHLPPVRLDPAAVAEVLYVLIENAAKYSPLHTDIAISAAQDGEDSLKVCVEDRGVGIPMELREKVFDKFFRVTTSELHSRDRTAGVGMGLAIARGIVEAHGGRIWIEDANGGKGTRVCFTIPMHQMEKAVAG